MTIYSRLSASSPRLSFWWCQELQHQQLNNRYRLATVSRRSTLANLVDALAVELAQLAATEPDREAAGPSVFVAVSGSFLPMPQLLNSLRPLDGPPINMGRLSISGEACYLSARVDWVLGKLTERASATDSDEIRQEIASMLSDLLVDASVDLGRDVGSRELGPSDVLSAPKSQPGWLCDSNDAWVISEEKLSGFLGAWIDWDQLDQAAAQRPKALIALDNSPLGALYRSAHGHAAVNESSETRQVTKWRLDDLDVIAVTTKRWRSVFELMKSIRQQLGTAVAITVVVQGPSTWRWRYLEREFSARCLHVERDTGLAQSRNIAVEATDRPLVFLMDDDFQLDDRCRISEALSILNAQPELSVLGGNLLDALHWSDPRESETSQGFAMRLLRQAPEIKWLRLEDSPRERRYVNPTDYYEHCDIVDNFAIIKRSDVFDKGVWWNSALKIGAEHQDLYLRLAQQTNAQVARTNTLKVRNVRVQDRKFRAMRNRTDQFFSRFFRDLTLRSFHIIGERIRVLAQDGGHAYQARQDAAPVYVGTTR